MKSKYRLIIGLNTKEANDASGKRTSAIWHHFQNNSCHLYVIEKHNKTINNNIHYSKIGYLYRSSKSNIVLRALLEIILAFEFIILNRKLIKASNWIWISSPPYIFSLIILFFLNGRNKEIVFDIKDLYPEVFQMTGTVNEKNILYKLLLKFTHTQLEDVTVIGATRGICKYYRTKLENKKIFMLLNGSDIKANNVDKKKGDIPFTAIFHGRLGKLQNLKMLKNLMLDLTEVSFLILSADKLFAAELRPKNVKELGTKSGSQLVQLIQKSHIGLSFRDNSELTKISNAVKIFDYFSCGTPILSSPFTEIEFHLGGSGLLKSFEYDKNEEIKNFIYHLSIDSGFYFKSFPNAGKANRKFNRKKIVQKFFLENNQIL